MQEYRHETSALCGSNCGQLIDSKVHLLQVIITQLQAKCLSGNQLLVASKNTNLCLLITNKAELTNHFERNDASSDDQLDKLF